MSKSILFLTIAAISFGSQSETFAQEDPTQPNRDQVTVAESAEPELDSEDVEPKLHDFKYIHCNFNFLGRILIRDGKFYFGLRGEFVEGEGLWVKSVERNSPAAKAGLAPGMLVTGLNGTVPDSREQFDRAFEKFDGILKMAYETSGSSSARNEKFDMRTYYLAAK
ncbi:MAG TPA: PDZ domain-containing protein [Planctomycetaceae bacterium]|nr:PDZ domain-containing protein [Planctomycetaceae bacterium]